MFGRDNKENETVSCAAEVIEAERTGWAVTRGNDGIASNTTVRWKFRVMVRPEGEPAFEVRFKAAIDQFAEPHTGSVIMVRYETADHSKVYYEAPSGIDGALAMLDAKRPGLSQTAVLGSSLGDLMRSAISDPKGLREQIQGMSAHHIPGVIMPQSNIDQDPVSQLERLVALRDRGVLSNEEFELQKARILGA
jgi:hypothetical protein